MPPPGPRRSEKSHKTRRPRGLGSQIARHEQFVARLLSVDAICAQIRRAEARADGPDPDRAASWVARHQLNLITALQLYACGIGPHAIASRMRRGLLHRVHHGVYLFGPLTFPPGARELAAVLACGESTLVSHRSATALYVLTKAINAPVDVTVIGSSGRRRDGIAAHRVAELHPDDRTLWNGIPITSPARTLLDFASQAQGDELERAIAEAYALKLVTETALRCVLDRYPQRHGAAALRAELDRVGGPAWTRSEAERRLKLLLRQAGLPFPRTNQHIARYPADFVWPDQRLIVEVDGFQFHGHRGAFERDRKRDAAHVLAGYRVIRITYRRLVEEPLAVIAIIARALERGAL
jgi:very-short-patch-repair endonuclease